MFDVDGDVKDGNLSGDDISIEEPEEEHVVHVRSSEGELENGENVDRVSTEQRIRKEFAGMKENLQEGNHIAVRLRNAELRALVLSISPDTNPKYLELLNVVVEEAFLGDNRVLCDHYVVKEEKEEK